MPDAIPSQAACAMDAPIVAAGAASADMAAIAGMRKRLPAWAPAGTAGHFLKHADEQTVVAVAAVDRAIQLGGIDLAEQRQWAIIAAPRFVGRLAGVNVLDRFARGGAPAVSPHVIPQHSLHSVSGALSILLSSRAANFGVGGSCESLAEGFFAALALGGLCNARGAWLVATAWEPEPTADATGTCTNSPVCHAFALALRPAAVATGLGRIRLVASTGEPADVSMAAAMPTVAQVAAALEQRSNSQAAQRFVCRSPWGAAVEIEVDAEVPQLKAAA
jgi:hypothetical protein